MHQRVAEALERLYEQDPGERLSELALHWRLATVSVDKTKAAGYALRAGKRALQSLAPAEALKLFADAVELTGDVQTVERCEALIGLGEAERQTGNPTHRQTLLEASRIASSLGDAELAASAALANNRGTAGSGTFGEVDQERIEAIERALELDDPPDPARRARLLALQAQELSWDPDFARRCALADEAIVLARSTDNRRTLASVLNFAFHGIWSAETLGLRSAIAEELTGLAVELGDPAMEVASQECMIQVGVERGDFPHAEATLERRKTLTEKLGQPSLMWGWTYESAGFELLRGHLTVGEGLAEQAFQIGQASQPVDAALIYGAQFIFARAYGGGAHEVIDLLTQSLDAYPGIAAWRAGLASILCMADRPDEARSIVEQAASDRFTHIAPNVAMLAALALYADAAANTRSTEAAALLYERMAPFSEQIVWTASSGYGHVRLWLGLLAAVLGKHELADQHLEFACEFHESNGVPLWAARGQLGWAQTLTARGQGPAAREHAIRALELAREHGYGAFEKPAAALVETGSAAGA
jgi:hypothetical protein